MNTKKAFLGDAPLERVLGVDPGGESRKLRKRVAEHVGRGFPAKFEIGDVFQSVAGSCGIVADPCIPSAVNGYHEAPVPDERRGRGEIGHFQIGVDVGLKFIQVANLGYVKERPHKLNFQRWFRVFGDFVRQGVVCASPGIVGTEGEEHPRRKDEPVRGKVLFDQMLIDGNTEQDEGQHHASTAKPAYRFEELEDTKVFLHR